MTMTPIEGQEHQSFSAWNSVEPPEQILVIRLHAIGDVALSMPACHSLHTLFPSATIDFLTSKNCSELPQSLTLFKNVFPVDIPPGRLGRLSEAIRWGRFLRKQEYDVIIDLQRNWITQIVRRTANPSAWGEFDRFSPLPAETRTLATFHKTGLRGVQNAFALQLRPDLKRKAVELLQCHGWTPALPTVVLNPAGLWKSRNWPLENYFELARMIIDEVDAQVLIIGTERIREKAAAIAGVFPKRTINLVCKTTLSLALATLEHCDGIISEDSGLMHMAWALGIPTVALFGSSRYDWSTPAGVHSRTFHSGDLECGACMQPTCRYGDVHCLTRYSPQTIFEAFRQLQVSGHSQPSLP